MKSRSFPLTRVFVALVAAFALQLHADKAEINLDTKPISPATKQKTSFAPILKTVTPSVVNVFTTKTVKMERHPMMDDPFFRRFFGVPQQPREAPERHQSSLGSGVILSADGYILTNNHVIAESDEIKVALANSDEEYIAKLIGTDPKTDIAVLKIDAKDLPAIIVGDSETLEVGDLVFAIGNPFGVGQTVTSGMVSAVGRGNLGITDYENFIQTDASINPGNSGGALIDAEGRLVGINTAILSRTGGNNGIGFAVPINMARSVMERLLEHGRVVRGFLGVVIQPVTKDLADRFDLKDNEGALISEVMDDSAAEEGGIKAGDVVIKFDGREVEDVRKLRLMVEATPPNKKVEVVVVRNGKRKAIDIKLKELPGDGELASMGSDSYIQSKFTKGLDLQSVDREMRRALDLPRDLEGALVASVDPESPAAEAGLRKGDIILEIEHQSVDNAADAYRKLADIKGDSALLYIMSNGRKRYVAMTSK